MKKAATAFILTLFLTACSQDRSEQRPPMIAVVMKSLANSFFVTMAEGVRSDHDKRQDEYRLLLNGTRNENDLAQQVAILDQMIAMRVKAIVIAPADSKAVIPALSRAIRQGIKVINIDNRLDPAILRQYGVTIPFVGPDNRKGASKVGAHAAANLKASDEVAIIEGIPTAENSRARRMGLEDAALAARLKIVSQQSASWDQARASEIAGALLIRYPHLKAIFAANDSMALGIASAVGQARRNVVITGFDNVEAIRPLLDSGAVAATADQHGAQIGVFGVNYALKAIQSDAPLPDLETPVDLITARTAKRH
ncbi:substrate-binding domain-containing protein [Sphingobium chlorophenolicum]|uniref:D-allose-binding periplasmic protein n=1 Tax=Sphingobium chlorophenolicum TaxID=46429 RepID=A0A081RF05_SPHCR|nr:substrate-binding domain-containing protein [Sphingobium chlorophenolicum]KEQ53778.1 D-allose-binding periplasmic protein precursor [Sphingobium chlorophenolicum]